MVRSVVGADQCGVDKSGMTSPNHILNLPQWNPNLHSTMMVQVLCFVFVPIASGFQTANLDLSRGFPKIYRAPGGKTETQFSRHTAYSTQTKSQRQGDSDLEEEYSFQGISANEHHTDDSFVGDLDIELLEEVLLELEGYDNTQLGSESFGRTLYLDDGSTNDYFELWNGESLAEVFGEDEGQIVSLTSSSNPSPSVALDEGYRESAAIGLENALLQGVVPVCAGVGSDGLPGDFGFDPLGLADKDLFLPAQNILLNLIPTSDDENASSGADSPRPKALILRDYREAEIRHGRLAMLAAVFWPFQEMLDQFVLPEDQFGPLLLGPVTLPYFPLLMTAIMLLLGYLDIYSQAIKDAEQIGEAFLPGDCFWDPLKILDGASDRTKRNMQERELFNGRAAMIAIAAYILEELTTRQALVEIEGNNLLLRPAYQVPFIQEFLDNQFALHATEAVVTTSAVIS